VPAEIREVVSFLEYGQTVIRKASGFIERRPKVEVIEG
jgi:hypothetical protein